MRASAFFSAAVLAASLAGTAAAQALPGNVTFGMTLPQLQQAQPALKRVPRPMRLAGGLVGGWSGDAIDVAGVALTPTYFLAEGQLQRVEYLASGAGPAAFTALLAWARRAWGPELSAAGPEGDYASWAAAEGDAYLQSAGGSVRLVVKRRVLKDAREL